MAATYNIDTVQIKRALAARWATLNPVLKDGEFGLEKDTRKYKIGDGVTAWVDLAYASSGGSVATPTTIRDALATLLDTNRLDASAIKNIPQPPDISTKVDKVAGKQLTENDYTTAEKQKLAAIVGQQNADWNAVVGVTKIENKPLIPDISTKVDKVAGKQLTENDYTTAEKLKLAAIVGQQNADWNAIGGVTKIENKPLIPDDYIAGVIVGNVLQADKLYIYPKITIAAQVIYNFNYTGAVITKGGIVSFVANGVVGHEPVFANGLLASGEFDNTNGKVNVLAYTYVDTNLVAYNWIVGKVTAETTYTHPTADGDKHVPANGTINNGKVLTASATAGVCTWETPAVTPSSQFWTLLAGATRISNTTFTVTGDLTAIISKGLIITWKEAGVAKMAMVAIPSVFSSVTTVTIIGDTMASIDASTLKYAAIGVEPFQKNFAVAGNIGAIATDVANAYYATEPMRVLGVDLQVGTAGTTNNTTVDINKGGTTLFTTKPTLATSIATSPTPFAADNNTTLALGDKVTIDIDAVQTTPAIDLYVNLYVVPTRYLNLI